MPQDTKTATLSWRGGMRFGTAAPDGGTLVLDGDGKAGVSPVQALLLSAAACSASDVVMILEKMRVELREFSLDARGVRLLDVGLGVAAEHGAGFCAGRSAMAIP